MRQCSSEPDTPEWTDLSHRQTGVLSNDGSGVPHLMAASSSGETPLAGATAPLARLMTVSELWPPPAYLTIWEANHVVG